MACPLSCDGVLRHMAHVMLYGMRVVWPTVLWQGSSLANRLAFRGALSWLKPSVDYTALLLASLEGAYAMAW